ncbi:hypothetical protein BTS2_2155 [Bacillus sp. TS-2]|nr:hypothetical protein BTS2_2155 [Bacillus sp. TS-2]
MPSQSTIYSLYMQQKQHISLLSRSEKEWHNTFPLSVRQTEFPLRFQQEKN